MWVLWFRRGTGRIGYVYGRRVRHLNDTQVLIDEDISDLFDSLMAEEQPLALAA